MNTTKDIEYFCNLARITPAQFRGEVPIDGTLRIKGDVTIPSGFTPLITGSLIPEKVSSVGDDFAPVVEGVLYLNRAITVGKGFAPVVGINLEMPRVTTIGDNFTPVVGGDLDLRRAVSIGKGFSPTVGGSLYLNSRKPTKTKNLDPTKPIESHDGKYIIADEWLTEVVSRDGNVWKVKSIGEDKVFYLVTNGSGNFAHGDTLEEAHEFLGYVLADFDSSYYEE